MGKGIEGATVLLPLRRTFHEERNYSTLSGENGAFELIVPVLGKEESVTFTLWAYAPDYQLQSASAYQNIHGTSDEPIDFVLGPATDTSFLVFDAVGKPIEGAIVAPRHIKTPAAYDFPPKALLPQIRGITDAEGRAKLAAIGREGLLRVEVTTPLYGTQHLRLVDAASEPAEREVYLRRAGGLEVRFAATNPAQVAGIRVYVESPYGDRLDGQTVGYAEGITDNNGVIRFEAIASGNAAIMESTDPKLPLCVRLPPAVAITEGQMNKVTIPVERGTLVRGVVRDKESGTPLPDVKVSVRYGIHRQGSSVTTGPDGRFEAYALPSKVYQQVIRCPKGYQQMGSPWSERFDVPSSDQPFELPPIELVKVNERHGRLVDQNGAPVSNVDITSVFGSRGYGFGKTDKDGKFVVEEPPGIKLEYNVHTAPRTFPVKARIVQVEPLLLQIDTSK
jgi:hypothetical protein